ncbi:Zinc finger CCHC domain-containing protein 4 [Oopsacas minuta]|uniref:Zinc finger CCHC domain-containing protein 4 n=1 Tax=Oopsacas minuta TaxID=111878 RepID=A0AAV7JQL6_9METZ|nr:Zinc finger CCHC domain-containing protein 4 [Oopsacas minuta]
MKLGNTAYLGVDYCDTPDDVITPYCAHGPTILFRRYLKDRPSRKFFACAVHRTKKGCPFFQWVDSSIDKKRQAANLKTFERNKRKNKWKRLRNRLKSFINYTSDECRRVCLTCETLLLSDETNEHKTHTIQQCISVQQLLQPSRIFLPDRERTSFAQEYFTSSTLQVINDNISELGVKRVICIGTPTLHESILSDSSRDVCTFLLDLDPKYGQFFNPNLYQRFNLFNTHFYSSNGAVKLQNFISSTELSLVLVVLDIPFGAKVDVIYSSLQRLWKLVGWNESVLTGGVPTLWIFPYFNGTEIIQKTNFCMLQYRVKYEYKYAKCKRGSPVRIFTNIPIQQFKLPTRSNEYKFCEDCNMFVFTNASHCSKCNSCESADGCSNHHCDTCGKCVKESFKHCLRCRVCHPVNVACLAPEDTRSKCHICKDYSHKRRQCPYNT